MAILTFSPWTEAHYHLISINGTYNFLFDGSPQGLTVYERGCRRNGPQYIHTNGTERYFIDPQDNLKTLTEVVIQADGKISLTPSRKLHPEPFFL